MFLICSYKLTKNRGGVTKNHVNKYPPRHHFVYPIDKRLCHHLIVFLSTFFFGDGSTNGLTIICVGVAIEGIDIRYMGLNSTSPNTKK